MKKRQKGMKEKEPKARKYCYFILFAVSTLLCIIFGALHANRSINAEKMNKISPKLYDTCSYPRYIRDPELTRSDYYEIKENAETYCEEN